MRTDFVLFGPAHRAILAAIPSMAAVLAWFGRNGAAKIRGVRLALGIALASNELVWYAYRLRTEGFRFPEGLPLQLCDFALWMTVTALLTLKPWSYEIAFYAGLGGSGMALLTPDLWALSWSYPTAYFFAAHGGVIVSVLFLTWSGASRPRTKSLWRTFVFLNIYMAAVGVFNFAFGTNYMYLRRKPESASLLDYLGPWPIYIVGAQVIALAVFTLLWLPFRRRE